MSILDYERFVAHGGDWGCHTSIELARFVPDRVSGLHLTMPLASPLPEDRASADDAEKRTIEKRGQFLMDGFGFGMIQGTATADARLLPARLPGRTRGVAR